MFQTKVVEQVKMHIICSIIFSENYSINEIVWKNMIEPDSPQMKVHDAQVLHRNGYFKTN